MAVVYNDRINRVHLEPPSSVSSTGLYRATRVVWYIFYAVETILAFRFLLRLIAANSAAAFTQVIYGISSPLVAPFRYIVGTPNVGGYAFEWTTVLAMLVYWVLAWGIVRLLLINRPVSTTEARQNLDAQDL